MKVVLLKDIGDKKAGDIISIASIYSARLIDENLAKEFKEVVKKKVKK